MSEQPTTEPTAQPPDEHFDYDRAGRYAMRAPLIGGMIIISVLLLLLVPRTPAQVSIVANCLVICFVLLPLLLCLLPMYLMLAVSVFYTRKLNTYTGDKLHVITTATRRAADTAATYGDRFSKRSIGWRARFAILNNIINTRPEGDRDDELED